MAQMAAGMYTRLNRQKNKRDLLERPILARHHDAEHQQRDAEEGDPLGNAEDPHGLGHADVLGHQGQPIDQRQIEDREPTPEGAEGVEDGLGMAALGHRAQADGHLLDVVGHRHEDDEGPEQAEAGFGAGLGVGGDAAGVVVGHHRDDARPHHGQQDQPAPLQPAHPVNALADPVHAQVSVVRMPLVSMYASKRIAFAGQKCPGRCRFPRVSV